MSNRAITPQEPRTIEPAKAATELVRGEAAPSAETAAQVLAAQAEALVKARTWVAMQRPRDLDAVRNAFLRECSRPSFATEALYSKPIGGNRDDEEGGGGKSIEGPSIRFAEAAAQAMGNIATDAAVIFDDGDTRRKRITVMDLEKNVTYAKDITFRKVVERQFLRGGEVAISARTNSRGRTVYLRRATDDEMLNTEGALESKALRTLLLRVVPGWLVAEGEAMVRATLEKENATDPDAQRKRLFSAFDSIGIPVQAVKDLIGHDCQALTPKEHAYLGGVYNAIKAGEATWQDVVEARLSVAESEEAARRRPPPAAVDADQAAKSKAAALAAALAGKAAPAQPAPQGATQREPQGGSPQAPPARAQAAATGAQAPPQAPPASQAAPAPAPQAKAEPPSPTERLRKLAEQAKDLPAQRPLMPMPPVGAPPPPRPAQEADEEPDEPGSRG